MVKNKEDTSEKKQEKRKTGGPLPRVRVPRALAGDHHRPPDAPAALPRGPCGRRGPRGEALRPRARCLRHEGAKLAKVAKLADFKKLMN